MNKHILTFASLLIACIISLSACKKSETKEVKKTEPTQAPGVNYITADLVFDDGREIHYSYSNDGDFNNTINKKDDSTGYNDFLLWTSDDATEGDYSLIITGLIPREGTYGPKVNEYEPHVTIVVGDKKEANDDGGYSTDFGGTLTCNVTSLTEKRIKGTFTSEPKKRDDNRTVIIKNGKFDMNFYITD